MRIHLKSGNSSEFIAGVQFFRVIHIRFVRRRIPWRCQDETSRGRPSMTAVSPGRGFLITTITYESLDVVVINTVGRICG